MNTPDRCLRILLFLRLGSLIWALLSLGFAAAVLILRTRDYIGLDFWPYGMPIVIALLTCAAPAALIAWNSQRLAAWIVPLGKCPQCSYSIKPDTSICPECGTPLK